MTVMFHDVHSDEQLEKQLEKDRVLGAFFFEILYADDTIIYSRSAATLTKLLRKIQDEGAKYGLKLNLAKCEAININTAGVVRFNNGKPVKQTDEAKYLGCLLNDNTEAKKEISKRIADTMATWKSWKNYGKR